MIDVFLKVLNLSLSGSFLVAAVVLLRPLLRKLPRWLHVLLWALVAVRLLLPVSVESTLSLAPNRDTVRPEIQYEASPQIHSGIEAVDSVINPIVSQTFAPNPVYSVNPLQVVLGVSANLWLLGVCGMLLYGAGSYLALRYRVASAVRLAGNVYQSERVGSPFVLGFLRPRIYLPFAMEEPDMVHVVAHERTHIRRRDHWWKPLGFALLCVHWFNPLLWLGYCLLCRDIELACDEKVVKDMNAKERVAYSQALVKCSARRASLAVCPLAFGEVGIKSRVKNVLYYKKPAFWLVVLAVVVAGVLSVCFLTDPPEENVADFWNRRDVSIQYQQRANLTLSVPVSAIPEQAYTDGWDFKEGEVIVYQTDTTAIWLRRVQPANEGAENLYFFFDFSHELPDSGRVLLPYWVNEQNSTVNAGVGLISRNLRDAAEEYPDAVALRSQGPDEQFGVYVDTAVCKGAEERLLMDIFCVELQYHTLGMDPLLLSSVAEQTYTVAELVYCLPGMDAPFVPGEDAPAYAVTEALTLLTQSGHGIPGWTELGYLTRGDLSRFEEAFSEAKGWADGHSARQLRSGNVNTWTLTGIHGGLTARYYLLQQKDGSLYLAHCLIHDVLHSDWVARLEVNPETVKSLLAVSGASTAALGTANSRTPLQTMLDQANVLPISFRNDDFAPFRIYADGEELTGHFSVYDAKSLQSLDFFRPSGLDPQAYLFQNAAYGGKYLVTLSFPGTSEDVLYFLAVLPEEEGQ